MVKITTCMSMLVLMLSVQFLKAQTEKDSLKLEVEARKEAVKDFKTSMIETLSKKKEVIIAEEKQKLKEAVKSIQEKEDKGEITAEIAQKQKEAAAKLAAQNIENKTAIINNQIELVERGESLPEDPNSFSSQKLVIGAGASGNDGESGDSEEVLFGISFKKGNKEIKYDRRTSSGLALAIGLNNTLVEGEGLDGSPYQVGKSTFFELGWMWKTRLFKEHNRVRFRYGLAFQFNSLTPDDNQYFVKDGNQTYLEEFPHNLKKNKFRMDNLVAPFFFEFGPSKEKQRDTYVRYSTAGKFKVGVGGYVGVNYSTRQKLKYKEDGDRQKDKIKNNYNTNNFIYGLAAYVGKGDLSLYMKYDLNPVFHNADVKQNNISLGVRLDL